MFGHGIGLEIRAVHLVTQVDEHFRDAAHAGAADADEMDGAYAAHQVAHARPPAARHTSATSSAASPRASARAERAMARGRPRSCSRPVRISASAVEGWRPWGSNTRRAPPPPGTLRCGFGDRPPLQGTARAARPSPLRRVPLPRQRRERHIAKSAWGSGRSHVVYERRDPLFHVMLSLQGGHRFLILDSGMMQYFHGTGTQLGDGRGYVLVQYACTLTAADDQQTRGPGAPGEALLRVTGRRRSRRRTACPRSAHGGRGSFPGNLPALLDALRGSGYGW